VPKGIINAVMYSALFGYIMVCTFVLVMPDLTEGVKHGLGFFDELMSSLPSGLRTILGLTIFILNFLCGLACLTSCSRMMFAFARDGGLPASNFLRTIHPTLKTPVAAVWVSGVLAVAATLYGDAFFVLAAGSAVFLHLSYTMPIAAGLLAEGKTWRHKGPFSLGGMSKILAVLAVIGGVFVQFIGMKPPNQKVFYLMIAMLVIMTIFWFVLGEKNRFKGPPAIHE
jgi:amino acid transporter